MDSGVTTWQLPPQTLTIDVGELHLWRFNLDCTLQALAISRSLLNEEEQKRADRLLDHQKKNQFIVSRSGLRRILGGYLDSDPQQVFFHHNQSGKPFLAASHCSILNFNLSHSGQWAVLAVTRGIRVGVDIEFIDTSMDYQQLATHYFDIRERESLSRYTQARQHRGFCRLWTQKESILKKVGSGFSQSTNVGKRNSKETSVWCKNFFLAPGYVAAVATDQQNLTMTKLTFPV